MLKPMLLAASVFFVGFYLIPCAVGLADNDPVTSADSSKGSWSTSISQQIEVLSQQATDCEMREYFDEGRRYLEKMLELCRKNYDEQNYITRSAKIRLEWHDWYAGLQDDERSTYRKARALFLDGQNYFNHEKYHEAIDSFQEAASLYEGIREPTIPQKAWLQDWIAESRLNCDRERAALDPAQKAFDIACQLFGEDSPLGLDTLVRLAAVHSQLGEYWKSIHELSKACGIWSKNATEFTQDQDAFDCYVDALLLSAWDFIAIGDYDRATLCLKEVAALNLPRTPFDNSKICRLRACEYAMLNSNGHSEDAFLKAEDWLKFAQHSFASEAEEVVNAKTAKLEMLVRLNNLNEAELLMKDIAPLDLEKNVATQLHNSNLTYIYAAMLVAKNQHTEAINILEPLTKGMENEFGPEFSGLRDPLKTYAIALRQVQREKAATDVESKIAKLQNSVQQLREQIDADPECKFPWELDKTSHPVK